MEQKTIKSADALLNKAAKTYALKFKTTSSSEGLQNIEDDFKAGAKWQKEYASQFKDSAGVADGVWVKASKRLPKNWNEVNVRDIESKLPVGDLKAVIAYHGIDVLEWLDESPQPITQSAGVEDGWISVEERLPKWGGYYYAVIDRKDEDGSDFIVLIIDYDAHYKTWKTSDGYDCNVIKWKPIIIPPLPKAPKQ